MEILDQSWFMFVVPLHCLAVCLPVVHAKYAVMGPFAGFGIVLLEWREILCVGTGLFDIS